MMRPPKALMNAKMTIKPNTGDSAYGPVYGKPFTVDAYIEPKKRVVTDKNGKEIVAEIFALIRDDVSIPFESLATWDWGEGNYSIKKAIPYRPLGKFSHIEAYLK